MAAKLSYFGTNFINWGWIGFTTAPATATATATATTTTAAAQRRLGGYDHGNGYDHDCGGSTTTAITTLTMVTIAAAMVTIAEPKSVDRHHFHPLRIPHSPPGDARHHPHQKDNLLPTARGLR